MSQKTRKERLSDRSCKIINKGGEFYLKREDGRYLGSWTNIAAGPDEAHWSKKDRLPFFNLEWAFAIAPLYKCKVVVVYPKKRQQPSHDDVPGIIVGSHTAARQALR